MTRIKVKFSFWKDKDSKTWIYTLLMGDDKVKVLESFNLVTIFPVNRVIKICELWNDFLILYNDMKNLQISGAEFATKAQQWIHLFLTPSRGNINRPGTLSVACIGWRTLLHIFMQ